MEEKYHVPMTQVDVDKDEVKKAVEKSRSKIYQIDYNSTHNTILSSNTIYRDIKQNVLNSFMIEQSKNI